MRHQSGHVLLSVRRFCSSVAVGIARIKSSKPYAISMRDAQERYGEILQANEANVLYLSVSLQKYTRE